MLTRAEALSLLGLSEGADRASIGRSYDLRRGDLEQRLVNAPTEGLRTKYQQQLGELVAAYEVLTGSAGGPTGPGGLSQTQLADLPVAGPGYTQHGPAAGAAGVRLKPGEVIADRYELRREVGVGGMGVVYEAYDRLKGESIALKVLLPHLLTHEKARERFLSEAKLACKLAHPHIVKVFDVGVWGSYHFLTMELLEGRTLREELAARKASRLEYPVERALACARQLIGALEYAHKRLVHRDLKPENVWVEEDGTFKLMDFGIARAFTTTELTKTGMALGTAYYMAPEQLAGEREIDWRADQYSLGVMLYELLTGRIPQGAIEAPADVRTEVPKPLSAAVMKAMATKREQRFESLEALGEALEKRRIAASLPSLSPTEALQAPWLRRAAVAAAVVLLLGGGAWYYRHQAEQQRLAAEAAEAERQRQAEEAERQRQAAEIEARLRGEARLRELAGPMVDIPGGEFRMGDNAGGGEADERPVHTVSIKPFRLGKHEVTVGEFRRFVEATQYPVADGCHVLSLTTGEWSESRKKGQNTASPNFKQTDTHPVTCVSWQDVQAYLAWLRAETGLKLRLPSEAEWEYAARAGSGQRYPWGEDANAGCAHANGVDQTPWPGDKRHWISKMECNDRYFFTAPVGSYRANGFEAHDMIGNVLEWTADCWNDSYHGAPNDGSAWTSGDCSRRVTRGGSWSFGPRELRASHRNWGGDAYRASSLGFRLAQDP